jgi:hypothetical protein
VAGLDAVDIRVGPEQPVAVGLRDVVVAEFPLRVDRIELGVVADQRGGEPGDGLRVIGDTDGDGNLEVAVGDGLLSELWVYAAPGSASAGGGALWSGTVRANPLTGRSSFGEEIAGPIDVNGDGYDDLVVAAPEHLSYAGAVLVFLGGPGGLGATPATTVLGPYARATVGDALAAGDLNGDGYDDVVVGVTGVAAGEAWVFLGGPSGIGTLPDVMAGIATRKVKWDRKYQTKHGIGTGRATDLPDGLEQRVAQLARRIYRALCLSGYARIDLRLKPDGSVFVLEANANPNLAQIEDFATSALSAGVGYQALLERIMRLGLAYQAAWRET